MIYFDNNNKNAYIQEIENPLCTVADEQWQEFNLQYIQKVKDKAKTVVFSKLTEKVRKLIIQTMEELSICFHFEKLSGYCFILKKNFKGKDRVPLDLSRVFRQRHLKYQVIQFNNY